MGCLSQEASALSPATWASLGLSLGLRVGFSGGPDPLKSTEVHQCCLTEFNLLGSRIFISECAHGMGAGHAVHFCHFDGLLWGLNAQRHSRLYRG